MNLRPSLQNLNDDCLNQIFRKCSFKDQLMLSRTCRRLCDFIMNRFWTRRYQEFDTSNIATKNLSYDEYEAFFMILAERVVTLIVADSTHNAFRSFRAEMAFYLSFEFPRMRQMEWNDERFAIDEMILFSDRWPSLEVLRLPNGILTGTHLQDTRCFWDALRRCESILELNLQESNRIDHLLNFIRDSPRLVHIYLSRQMGNCRAKLSEIMDELIAILHAQPTRSPLTISSAYMPIQLTTLESYVQQNVLIFETEDIDEIRPRPTYIEFRFESEDYCANEVEFRVENELFVNDGKSDDMSNDENAVNDNGQNAVDRMNDENPVNDEINEANVNDVNMSVL